MKNRVTYLLASRRFGEKPILSLFTVMAAVWAAVVVGGMTKKVSGDQPTRPNFIFLIVDDVSAEDLGCYGNHAIQTPNLDRLASGGMVFENAYLTISSCSPSRCSMITGRYPHNTGAPELHTNLPADQFRFPAALTAAGYHTVRSGKHHGEQSNESFSMTDAGKGQGKMGTWVDLLRDRSRDKPFFFWLASTDAHRGWSKSDGIPNYDPADVIVPPYLVDGPATRQDLADYYHEVSRTDDMVGQLLAELERQGVAENTYFIYCADNGRPFPRCKTFLFDDGIKTPLIISCPGTVEPARTQSLVSSIDFAPTILELAGLEIDQRVQGVSLRPILEVPNAVTRDYVFAEHNWHVFQNHERMVRSGDHVYIRNAWPERQVLCSESTATFPAGIELWDAHEAGLLNAVQSRMFELPQPAEQLYDLNGDPDPTKNLAGLPQHASKLKEMRELMDRWAAETGDSIPANPSTDRYNTTRYKEGAPASNPEHRVGEFPGASQNASSNNHPGPIRK